VDEIFEVVVDSAFVGARKPEPRIYELTLERLGVSAAAALFIDDVEANCDGARAVGMRAVWFQNTEQALAEIEAILADDGGRPRAEDGGRRQAEDGGRPQPDADDTDHGSRVEVDRGDGAESGA
jgi:beta-phosphoglucomutase-like phosphatase (HAD superfamily)